MNSPSHHIKKWFIIAAALLALFIGLLSVVAGSKILLGIDSKDYHILIWLVIYNVIFGALSIGAAFWIWWDRPKSKRLPFFILISHSTVLLYLKFISTAAAIESINAMVLRVIIWVSIVILTLLIPKYDQRKKATP